MCSSDLLVAGCASREDALRLSSFEVLETVGALPQADLVAYHAANLTFKHWPKGRTEALAFLQVRAAPAERERAVAALKAAAAELEARNDSDSRDMLEKVRAALAGMEGSAP